MPTRPFLILDGNSLLHRAFHALPPLSNSEGIFTNAVYGFLMMMLKVVHEHDPAYLAVAFDMKKPTFRHKEYQAYKAGRKPAAPELVPQFELVRQVLEAMQVRILEKETFEADDILGTMARRCEEAGIPCLMVTGDRDSMQLVSSTSHVLYTKRGVTEIIEYTPERVFEDFGVTPEHIPDLKGLMGDASDNIPGIPGIGAKTAASLLSTYATVEDIIKAADKELKGKQREKILDGAVSGLLSKKLATITRYVPLDEVSLEDCRLGDLRSGLPLIQKLGMNTIVRQLGTPDRESPQQEISGPQIAWQEEIPLSSLEDISGFVQKSWNGDTEPCIAILTCDTNLTLARSDGQRARISLQGDLLNPGLDPSSALHALSPLFEGQTPLMLYDAKHLMGRLHQENLSLYAPFDDDLLLQYLLNPQQSRYEQPEDAAALYSRTIKDKHLVKAAEMENVYSSIDLPLTATLFDMETVGFLTDSSVLRELGQGYDMEITRLKEEIYRLSGENFNINSPKQLGEVLFEHLKLPAGKKTSRGYSTDADTLQKLADQHEIIPLILSYRQLSKLKSTYIDGLLGLTGPDGRIHSWFDQTIAATGRISSSEPNLQNIPVRTALGREIRRAFVAREGFVLVDADYSQIELRLLAHLSGDAAMCDAFNRGQDVHARTAAEVYDVPLEEVTSQMRSSAKAVNFGIVYGISDFGLASNLNISRREAASFIERYLSRYPAIHDYMKQSVTQGKTLGYARTLYGRRRPLPELSSPNYNMRQFGERVAMNMPVQGTAADIIKMAMNAVHAELKRRNLKARLILQVHDELIVESPLEEETEVTDLLRSCMEQVASLKVPLIVDIHSGKSWFDSK